ncbi:MAG: hypothetical protein DIU68_000980 [Chloroflexota bacterium]|nr:MAG: hypothetical protein DIU68_07410 [Chloroflexota bacterium]
MVQASRDNLLEQAVRRIACPHCAIGVVCQPEREYAGNYALLPLHLTEKATTEPLETIRGTFEGMPGFGPYRSIEKGQQQWLTN